MVTAATRHSHDRPFRFLYRVGRKTHTDNIVLTVQGRVDTTL